MRILIIGSNGLLGRDLVAEWTGDVIIPATSRDADIREPGQVRQLVARERPDWVILTAAYTDVDGSERNPDLAFTVNRDGTKNVSLVARELGVKLCYLSTDYVFDGTSDRPYEPDDAILPLNVYGASKAAGEKAVQEHAGHWLIARTSWLFGAGQPSFPEKILQAADSQPELKVVADQIGSPTYTKDLATAIRELVHSDAHGILNITNSGSCSWFEFAKETLHRAGRSTTIFPITSGQAGRLAARPAYSVLSPRALASYGIALRSWQEALQAYLVDLRQKGKLR
ncbi:MAG TPA: dTDP-4-dehydrorhamnose reductase [Candidatus Acidoferrum sp.]|jgi:dTDP-4-dehydrorhamnose reductase|nr:dTDP-4-dehydrorhamnose reductase [Candidatus Acidoferrum sp.]